MRTMAREWFAGLEEMKNLKNMVDKQGKKQYTYKVPRGVAQLGRALRSGRRGRRFKSCHLDHV